MSRGRVRCAVVGYGPAFNMGKYHCEMIRATPGLELVGVCDADKSRIEAATRDFPGLRMFDSIESLVEDPGMDLVTIVTPHNTHAELALKAIRAGKNVIVEKPMCITVEEADSMIQEAKNSNSMLTVFHCRRVDADHRAMKEIITKGLMGQIFHVEFCGSGYGHPGYSWRSNKRVSGGTLYDWGAHVLDWILTLVDGRVVGVNGHFQKLVWNDVTNEDHAEATMVFESGAVADLQMSSIDIIGKLRWRILGTKGGMSLDREDGTLRLFSYLQGYTFQTTVPYVTGPKGRDWTEYYKNIAEHMLQGKELMVKPEEARRVIAVLQAAERSAKSGRTEQVCI